MLYSNKNIRCYSFGDVDNLEDREQKLEKDREEVRNLQAMTPHVTT